MGSSTSAPAKGAQAAYRRTSASTDLFVGIDRKKKGYARAYIHYHGRESHLGGGGLGEEMREQWCAYGNQGRKNLVSASVDRVFVHPEWKKKTSCTCTGAAFSWSETSFDGSHYSEHPQLSRIPLEDFGKLIYTLNSKLDRSFPFQYGDTYVDSIKRILRRANAHFPFATFILHVHKYSNESGEGRMKETRLHVLEIGIKLNGTRVTVRAVTPGTDPEDIDPCHKMEAPQSATKLLEVSQEELLGMEGVVIGGADSACSMSIADDPEQGGL
jgi:hypothetical protein